MLQMLKSAALEVSYQLNSSTEKKVFLKFVYASYPIIYLCALILPVIGNIIEAV